MTQPRIVGTVTPVASGAPDATLLVLGPSLGTTTSLWTGALTALAATHRVVRFDLPGHGSSPATREPFTIAEVADGVIALVDSLGGGAFHYAGISFGGAVGLELALRHPERVVSLSVICSGAKIGTAEGWIERAAAARASGTASLVAGSASRWFAPGFLDRDPGAGSRALSELLDIDDESYALCCEALAAFDVRDDVPGLAVPLLAVGGEFDAPTPPVRLRWLAETAPDASFELIEGVAHLPAIEKPDEVAGLVTGHIDRVWTARRVRASDVGAGDAGGAEAGAAGGVGVEGASVVDATEEHAESVSRTASDTRTAPGSRTADEAYDDGMAVRRAVLGAAHVDRATAAITAETADFQDFITRYAWGEIWARPGLDRRTRSFLTIAALVTGGHHNEIGMHVRAGLTNGLTRAEISEAILHTAIYAGVPAANSAFAIAREVFASLDAEQG